MNGDDSVSAFPEGDNLFSWVGSITGNESISCHLSLSGCFACTVWLNYWNWTGLYLYCAVAGSAGTVYDGLAYKLSIKFPSGQGGACYPYAPPVVKFETPCFHPNVDQHGNICLDILKEKWSACYNIRTILLSIQSMLGDPNNESPLNGYAAALWDNQEEYRKTNLRKYEEDKKDGDSSWTSSIQKVYLRKALSTYDTRIRNVMCTSISHWRTEAGATI